MTERQLIEDHIPELAEIVGEARKLTPQEYEDWRSFALNSANRENQRFYRTCTTLNRTVLARRKVCITKYSNQSIYQKW